MKNLIKSLISFVIILAMLTSVFSLSVSAAGNMVISLSADSVSVEDTVTVTVTFNAGEAMYAVSCVVNYDSSILEYKSGAGTGGAGTLQIVESPSGESSVSYNLTFIAKKAGSSNVSVSNAFYSGLYSYKGLSGTSATINVAVIIPSFIAVIKNPDKMEYAKGTVFDPTGMELAVFDDDTYKVITIGFETEYDFSKTGKSKVTIKYAGINTSIIVTVTDKILSSIAVVKSPDRILKGSALDSSEMILALLYDDGSYEKITTGWTLEYNFSTSGLETVIINYAGKTTYFTVLVTDADINDDGHIGAADLTVLKKCLFDIADDTLNYKAADVNSDGEINILDLIYLKKLYAASNTVKDN